MDLIVLGLDGATFDIIKPLIESGKLPTFKKVMENGSYGKLRSTRIPISPSAWSSFLTGLRPINNSIFDFVKRVENSYEFRPVNSSDRKGTNIWECLEDSNKTCGILNVPSTYPPEDINNFMISGFPCPTNIKWIKPRELLEELEENLGEINLQPEVFYTEGNEVNFIKDQYRCWENTERIFDYLWNKKDLDIFIAVFKPLDEILHGLWKSIDETYPSHEKYRKYKKDVLGLYKKADELLSKIIKEKAKDTSLIIMSDHGFGPVHSTLYMNNWLIDQGYMKFKDNLGTNFKRLLHNLGFNLENMFNFGKKIGLMKFAKKIAYPSDGKSFLSKIIDNLFLYFKDIDWERTKAYSRGNFGQIYINKKGREPRGCIDEKEYSRVVNEIYNKLKNFKDPRTGERIFDKIFKRDEIYKGKYKERAPDLIFFDKNFEYTANRMFEFGSNKLVGENVIDRSGDHKPYGIFIAYGKEFKENFQIKNAEIVDLMPTILYLLNCKIPERVDGKILKEIFKEEWDKKLKAEFKNFREKLTRERGKYKEEKKIKKRLKKVGYNV